MAIANSDETQFELFNKFGRQYSLNAVAPLAFSVSDRLDFFFLPLFGFLAAECLMSAFLYERYWSFHFGPLSLCGSERT
jgi:hypothetical protein